MAKKRTQVIVFRGDRLRELRERAELTQDGLAEILFGNVDPNKQKYISRWETGLFNPDLPMLKRLVNHFSVTADYLLGESDDPHGHSPLTGDDIVGPNIDNFDPDKPRKPPENDA